MNRFQRTYLFLFLFSLLGTIGNIETNVETPMIWKVILIVTGFLMTGKIIYITKK